MTEALRVEQLHVQLGASALLHDISFCARSGALLAVAGPNGAGKSTLLKALLGLLPSSGRIQLEGTPLRTLSATQRARTIAYIPQRSSVMAGVSVIDVIAQARYAHRDRFGRTDLGDAAIASAVEHTELSPLLERNYDTLSGGEQRRVLLARALATGARVLLFDEPTAGLDIAHVLRFFRLTRRLRAEGHALVCVLHDLADVRRYADEALLLDAGRCVASGAVDAVLSAEHIARVYGVHVHDSAGLAFSLDGSWP